MNLPTKEEIEKLWDEYHVPGNVRAHSRQTAKVAVFLAKKLNEKGIDVNTELVEMAALLHDLTRTANFENFDMQKGATKEDAEFWKKLKQKYGNMHHADSAANLLKEKYPEVAEVIRTHTIENQRKGLLGKSWEIKLLNYADTRVLHDKIVSIEDRFKDTRQRHGWFFEKLHNETGIRYRDIIEENMRRLEKNIFEHIDIKPEDINRL